MFMMLRKKPGRCDKHRASQHALVCGHFFRVGSWPDLSGPLHFDERILVPIDLAYAHMRD